MIINPVTITVSGHNLVEVVNALQRVLNTLTPDSPTYRRFESALEEIIDARSAALRQKRSA